MRYLVFITLFFLVFLLHGCKINYSFSGANISPEIKTVSVQFFPNRVTPGNGFVNPNFSQTFTDALKDKIKAQTSLNFETDLGDVNFEGEITRYEAEPLAVTGREVAELNRFTITVRVKYTNAVNPDESFDTRFSRYEDYESSKDLQSIEQDLSEKILEQLTEDIFNQAFVNW